MILLYMLVMISDVIFGITSTEHRFNKIVTYISYGLYGVLFVILSFLNLSYGIIFLITYIVYITLYLILSTGNWFKKAFLLTTYSVIFTIFFGVCLCLHLLNFPYAYILIAFGDICVFTASQFITYKLLVPNFKKAEKDINSGWVKLLIGNLIFFVMLEMQILYPYKLTFDEPLRIVIFFISALAYFFSYDVIFTNFRNTISSNNKEIENMLLKEIAYTDPVTTLLNKNSYNANIKYYKEIYERDNNLSLMIVVIDVNKFKNINDTYGHLKGDEVLREVACNIRDCFNDKFSKVYRIGGDEFVVTIENPDEKIVKNKFQNINKEYDKKIKVTIAYGYAFVDFNSKNPFDEAFEKADKNMYKDKNKTR